MIVQALRALQTRLGWLPKHELRKVANRLGVPLHRVQEVASCFPHFRLTPPPRLTVQVCRDMACHLRGAPMLIEALEQWKARSAGSSSAEASRRDLMAPPDAGSPAIEGVSCLGRCDRAPVVRIGHRNFVGRTPNEIVAIVERAAAGVDTPDPDTDAAQPRHAAGPWKIDVYANDPSLAPYEAARRFVAAYPRPGDLPRSDQEERIALLRDLKEASLLGMGGAGVAAFKKWMDVLNAEGSEKYIVCNGDESEPATFKDRELLLRTPHLIVEGVLLAGLLTNATRGYIYIRHEYDEQIEAVGREIERARQLGACGTSVFGTDRSFPIEVFVSPGGYICGEQSALLEAMEDRRAEPRNRPPEIATNGLNDKPTLVSNVETYAWAPAIALGGGSAHAAQGRISCRGVRFFSVCGDVERPGVYEVPIGITLGDLIAEHCGGMLGGRRFKAVASSGPSGGFLPAWLPVQGRAEDYRKRIAKARAAGRLTDEIAMIEWLVENKLRSGETHVNVLDLPMDLIFYRNLGLMLGAGLVVYAEETDLFLQALNASEFFRNESCGKCVPCRLGSQRIVEIAEAVRAGSYDDKEFAAAVRTVDDLGKVMELTSICGLGTVAFKPLQSILRHFPEEVERHRRRSGAAPSSGSEARDSEVRP